MSNDDVTIPRETAQELVAQLRVLREYREATLADRVTVTIGPRLDEWIDLLDPKSRSLGDEVLAALSETCGSHRDGCYHCETDTKRVLAIFQARIEGLAKPGVLTTFDASIEYIIDALFEVTP